METPRGVAKFGAVGGDRQRADRGKGAAGVLLGLEVRRLAGADLELTKATTYTQIVSHGFVNCKVEAGFKGKSCEELRKVLATEFEDLAGVESRSAD